MNIINIFFKTIGVDLCVIENGYVYHTKYDRPEIIPIGTYQNVGDNVLALTKALANAPELSAPNVSIIID